MPKAKPAATLQAKGKGKTIEDTKPALGRPPVMTEAVQLEICARMAEGESLSAVCRDPDLPARSTVTRFLVGEGPENSAFCKRYAQARESLLDVYAEQIISISDDGTTDYITKTGRNGHEYEAVDQEHIQRSRLRVDSRRWLLSKLRPNEYGDKVVAEVSGGLIHTHDITSLSEREKMRRLALFMVEDQQANPAIEGQAAEVFEPIKESDSGQPDPPASH